MTWKLLHLHDRCTPGGEFDASLMGEHMDDLGITGNDRKLARKVVIEMHRTVQEYFKSQNPKSEE